MIFSVVGQCLFVEYALNPVQATPHDGQARRFAVQRFQRQEDREGKQHAADEIRQRHQFRKIQPDAKRYDTRHADGIEHVEHNHPRQLRKLEFERSVPRLAEVFCQILRLFAEQIIALDDAYALDMGDDRIRQFLVLLLADIAVLYARLIHKDGGDNDRQRHACDEQPDTPVDDVHERNHKKRRKAVAQHIRNRLHDVFFHEHHVGREHRAYFADIARRKVAHREFPKARAQFHALFCKNLISRRALQTVA